MGDALPDEHVGDALPDEHVGDVLGARAVGDALRAEHVFPRFASGSACRDLPPLQAQHARPWFGLGLAL